MVVLVHDLKDHSSRYRDLGVSFANRGLALCGFDLRGHGYSEGCAITSIRWSASSRIWRRWSSACATGRRASRCSSWGRASAPTWPACTPSQTKTPLAGVILSAPILREKLKRTDRMGIRAYAILLPRSNRYELDLARFSNEQRVVESLQNDALIYKDKATASTAGEVLRASDELDRRATDLNVPLLVLLGSEDKIINPAPVRSLHERAATSDKKLQTYEGLSHTLFHGSGRNVVINDVADWIGAHAEAIEEKAAAAAPPAPAAAAAPGDAPSAAALAKEPARATSPAAAPKKAALKKSARARRR